MEFHNNWAEDSATEPRSSLPAWSVDAGLRCSHSRLGALTLCSNLRRRQHLHRHRCQLGASTLKPTDVAAGPAEIINADLA
eukprot:3562209-Rhodomonas_salina.1